MAAPNMTPARPGQVNSAGDDRALFLKQYAGEVLTAFSETNVAKDRHVTRTIASGKSAQFPALGKAEASYHTPGTQIEGQTLNANERIITIDDLLIAPVFIANIDEAMSHYEFRSEYSKQAGAALARAFDKNVLQVMALAARATATVTGGNGGTRIVEANAKTDVGALEDAIFGAVEAMDEKDVPSNDRYVFLPPALYYLMVNKSDRVIHSDYNKEANGSFASGKVYRIAGAEIVKTNNSPSTNVTAGPTAYRGDFSDTAALVVQRSAVGTVKLIDLAVEMDYLTTHQGTLVVAKYAVGHGILRPECAVEIATAALP